MAAKIKKASPHDVKKAFGIHAERVLAVIDNNADCLEGLVLQVEFLTAERNRLHAQIDTLEQRLTKMEPQPLSAVFTPNKMNGATHGD